jgi:Zn-finger nucleic acid-binding protein
MNCPACKDPDLVISERQGIEIDYCPKCRGIWLDRGELDKIIERSTSSDTSQHRDSKRRDSDSREHYGHHDSDSKSARTHPPKKRGGFLSDLFDF